MRCDWRSVTGEIHWRQSNSFCPAIFTLRTFLLFYAAKGWQLDIWEFRGSTE